MADLDLVKINKTATRVQELCRSIEETKENLELLALPEGSIQLRARLLGLEGGSTVHLALGPEHREWVIQRLRQRVLDFENELKEIVEFVY